MSEEKTNVEKLQEELCLNLKNAALIMDDEEIKKADEFCQGYKHFLSNCKTERQAAAFAAEAAANAGFEPFDPKASYKAGDRV